MEHEVQGWRRWIPVLLGMGLTSFIFWMAQPAIMSPRGATGPTLLLADRPIVAVGVMLVCLVFASGVAIAVGRLVNAVTGLFVLGWGLAILTMRCAMMDEIAFTLSAPLWVIVLETLMWSAVVLGLTLLMFQFGRTTDDLEPDPDDPETCKLFSTESLKGAAAGLIIIAAVWVIARSEMKGQVFAAAMLGSMGAGLVGRLVAPHGSAILLFAVPCLFGAVGQTIGLLSTSAPLDDAFVSNSVSPFLLVSPLDLAAGSLTGVALGVGWAKSFLHHQPAPA
jgi:hypothetical protein